jgi:RND family efflux transporter MFP subunit
MHTAIKEPPTLAKRIAALVALLTLLGLGAALASRFSAAAATQAQLATEREANAAAAGEAPSVEVVVPIAAALPRMVILQGSLEPAQAADLSFAVPGRVRTVSVSLGDHVHAGATLATLDRASVGAAQDQTEAAIAVAQANVDMARDHAAVIERLAASGATPQRELIQAQQQLAVAQAQLAQAQAGMRTVSTSSADHSMRAPFDGVMTRVPDGTGAIAAPGVVVARIEDLSALRLHTTVSESELAMLHEGMQARLESGGAVGTITGIVRSLDPTTRRAPVEVRVPNEDGALVAHAIVRAQVIVGEPMPAWRIPATARRPNGTVLVVDASGTVTSRPIEAQSDLEGHWLVTSGITDGDRIVVRPATTHEGAIVAPHLPETTAATASR